MGAIARFAALACFGGLVAVAAPAAALPGGPMSPPAAEGMGILHRADIFRDCQVINGRWRCRDCRYVRRCDRSGCYWTERCRWGPPAPPIRQ